MRSRVPLRAPRIGCIGQRSEGTNTVLFPDVEGTFPLSYVYRSVTLYTTKSLEYTHDQQFVHLTEDGIWIDSDSDDDEW
jgi:hypothetical protein